MEMRLEGGNYGKRFKQVIVDSQRFDRSEAKTAKSLDCSRPFDKLRKRYLAVLSVQPQMHPGEHNLPAAGRNNGPNLLQNVAWRSADREPARVGNCTVGTEVIAAVLHLDEGACMKKRPREKKGIPLRTAQYIFSANRKAPGSVPEEL